MLRLLGVVITIPYVKMFNDWFRKNIHHFITSRDNPNSCVFVISLVIDFLILLPMSIIEYLYGDFVIMDFFMGICIGILCYGLLSGMINVGVLQDLYVELRNGNSKDVKLLVNVILNKSFVPDHKTWSSDAERMTTSLSDQRYLESMRPYITPRDWLLISAKFK